jgi:hypothetical protein
MSDQLRALCGYQASSSQTGVCVVAVASTARFSRIPYQASSSRRLGVVGCVYVWRLVPAARFVRQVCTQTRIGNY